MRKHGVKARRLAGGVDRVLELSQEVMRAKDGACYCYRRPAGYGPCPSCFARAVYATICGVSGGVK